MKASIRPATPWVAPLHKIGLLLACLLLLTVTAFAQSTNDWTDDDDDDEDEPVEEKALLDSRPTKVDDVTIKLNDEVFTWQEELTIDREDTLSISVRNLAPASRVEITADKGGINIGRKIYWANNQGELDLEVRVGNKKMKGNITLGYTPVGNTKKEHSVHLIVD
jgi:hypothetical protein